MAFVTRKFAPTGQVPTGERPMAPHAPGAVRSPQTPGEVPDRSSVPEHGTLPVPLPPEGPELPLTEYGTSQRIMHVYDKKDLDPTDPKRFIQAPPSYEEMRKATPRLRQPLRPMPGFALNGGSRLPSDELAALNAAAEKETLVEPGG